MDFTEQCTIVVAVFGISRDENCLSWKGPSWIYATLQMSYNNEEGEFQTVRIESPGIMWHIARINDSPCFKCFGFFAARVYALTFDSLTPYPISIR